MKERENEGEKEREQRKIKNRGQEDIIDSKKVKQGRV